jgi:hypothetical protein
MGGPLIDFLYFAHFDDFLGPALLANCDCVSRFILIFESVNFESWQLCVCLSSLVYFPHFV